MAVAEALDTCVSATNTPIDEFIIDNDAYYCINYRYMSIRRGGEL